MEADTMSLRKAAPQWSLAGDKQLLGMLEKIHQTIVSKCQDANAKLETMVDALDNASVDLQNVNNKFMALSNSQFVESRVYDDDVDVAVEDAKKQEQPKVPTNEDKTEIIRKALENLEMMHEPVEIMDSDSSDDEESSMILKPRDIYSHRPLPYVIGSFAWKSKWHAGLVREESDSDSSMSKHEEAEEYSESEPEPARPPAPRTISSSSSLHSDISKEHLPQLQQTGRLAGALLQVPAAQTVPIEVPEPSRTVYKVEKPAPAAIFSDSPPPPPLPEDAQAECSDDDIFAELHRGAAPSRAGPSLSTRPHDVMRELFGDVGGAGVGPHPAVEVEPNSSLRENSTAFDNNRESTTEVSVKDVTTDTDINSKKPVGGISLFGTNKGTESIGAAILKRNQRKMSTSDEENDVIEQKVPKSENRQMNKSKQPDSKNIIEDLFVKPAKKVDKDIRIKQSNIKVVRKEPEQEQKVAKPTDKIDLFSDNLFDDIDDIFTTNVQHTKPKVDTNTKSIFADDDLFSEISVEKSEKSNKKLVSNKSIFDDDDDLFTENDRTPKASSTIVETSSEKAVKANEEFKKVKSIFDDDSEDDLFSDIKVTKTEPKVTNLSKETNSNLNISSKSINTQKSEKRNVDENNDILFKNHDRESNTINVSTDIQNNTQAEQFQSPNLFDAEDDELFNTTKQINQIPKQLDITNKLLYSEDKTTEISNENVIVKNDIEDNYENENISNEPSKFEPNVSNDESFNRGSTRVNSESNDSNTEPGIENERKPNEKDILQDELTSEIFAGKSETERNRKSEIKSDDDPFGDIFTDLPPVFERPSEPKKSKNVNALFDDDSDDESLFFKKDDVISDEKPDVNFDSDRFRIFHDEPPDIEVDFSQKPLKISNEQNNVFNTEEDTVEDHSEDKPVEYILPQSFDDLSNNRIKTIQSNDEAKILENSKSQAIDISKLLEDVIANEENNDIDIVNSKVSQENTDTNIKDIQTNEEVIDSSEEIEKKPVGKLKPMNFNINVNTLLPGASPKKSKINEETDGQSTSTQSNEELSTHSPTKDLTMVKSVSFDGDPDSGILDNKLSKERAKIQVKRRPSTRRARLEAVRKSRIDLESDSTDNSSSFEESRNAKTDEVKKIKTDERRIIQVDEIDSKLEKDKSKEDIDIETNTSTNVDVTSIAPKIEQNIPKKSEVKSKVVYILNDEDIFSTPTKTIANIQNSHQNVLSIVDDDGDGDELFKTSNTKTQYKEEKKNKVELNSDLKTKITNKNILTNANKAKNSIFGDSDDDEELFGKKKINKEKKANIFDSDTDEDAKLFTNKKKMETKEITQGPLFGDESDDDELFGAKPKSKT